MPKLSQTDRILAHLQAGQTLTSKQAIDLFGCTRLAARIYDLREEGHVIMARDRTVNNRYGERVRVTEYYIHGQIELAL